MNCIQCNKKLCGKQTKYCSSRCKAAIYNNCYGFQKERAVKRKRQFVNLLGGKCNKCGYNKNLASLVFHHKEPTKKNFALDSRKLSNTTMKKLEIELDKCELLCHNCHCELHYPHFDNWNTK